MMNRLNDYLASGDYVGMDRYLVLQRRADGFVACRFGITSLGPIGFFVGLIVGYVFFG